MLEEMEEMEEMEDVKTTPLLGVKNVEVQQKTDTDLVLEGP